jgi:hypothetical protein
VQQKTTYTDFQSIFFQARPCGEHPEPIVSSTSSIGGFSPGPQGFGLFSEGSAGPARATPAHMIFRRLIAAAGEPFKA